MPRPYLLWASGVFIFAAIGSESAAQTFTGIPRNDPARLVDSQLAFSHDGHILREHSAVEQRVPSNDFRVRITDYDAATRAVIHERTLCSFTRVESQTTDGRILVVAEEDADGNAPEQLSLVNADTGEAQPIPSDWFDPYTEQRLAQISGDGRFVSAYSENGPQESPMVVTLYDWKTKKAVAKQMDSFPAGGVAWGGVTEDGKIEFEYSRSGSEIVDPKTGRALMHESDDSVRSPDGAWEVEFPYSTYSDPGTDVTIVHGEDGRPAGKLDLQLTDDQREQRWPGAFCGTSGRFVTAIGDTVYVFTIPSGKKIASFAAATWRDDAVQDPVRFSLACTDDGKRVAIRSGSRLTIQDVK